MSTFHYLAADSDGKKQKGTINADTKNHVANVLREKNLYPLEITQIRNTGAKNKLRSRIKPAQICLFTRSLATLIRAGLPLETALQTLSEASQKNMATLILSLRNQLLEGNGFADSLREYPHYFSNLYCGAVEAGEQTGKLDKVLLQLAQHQEKQQQLATNVKQAFLYPCIMASVAISIVTFLLIYIVPKIVTVFSETSQTLPLATQLLLAASHFLQKDGLWLLITLLLLFVGIVKCLQKPQIKSILDALLLRTPGIRYLIKTYYSAIYCRALATMMAASVPALVAISSANRMILNTKLQRKFLHLEKNVRDGENLFDAMGQTKCFSPVTLQLIKSGEQAGELAAMFEYAANQEQDIIDRIIKSGLTLLEPLIILMMGGIVLFIVLAILLPIFSLDQTLTV